MCSQLLPALLQSPWCCQETCLAAEPPARTSLDPQSGSPKTERHLPSTLLLKRYYGSTLLVRDINILLNKMLIIYGSIAVQTLTALKVREKLQELQ